MFEGLLRAAARGASAVVVVSFALLALGQTHEASARSGLSFPARFGRA